MKYLSIILFFCFIALTVIPCPKLFLDSEKAALCCSDSQNEQSKNNSDNQHSDNDCNGCNPLASCHCCSLVFSLMQPLGIACIATYQTKNISYCEFIPPTVIFTIWHPPEIT